MFMSLSDIYVSGREEGSKEGDREGREGSKGGDREGRGESKEGDMEGREIKGGHVERKRENNSATSKMWLNNSATSIQPE